jgi:hypothetical protein
LTAATTGFGSSSKALIARWTSATIASAPAGSAAAANSPTSRPEENALPAPVTSTARTAGSAAALAAAASSSPNIWRSIAFSFSGRSRVTVATWRATW